MATPVTKEDALAMVEETTEQLARVQRRSQSLAEVNRKMSEQLAHTPVLPSVVTGSISVTAAAATSFADGYATKPGAKEGEEEIAISVGAVALSTGVAIATGPGKVKDAAIAVAEGAASGLAARAGFKEGQKARIKAEAAMARDKAAKAT